MARRFSFFGTLPLAFLLLSGCAFTPEEEPPQGEEAAATTSASQADLQKLYEAPDRAALSCVSTVPLSVRHPFEDIPFYCTAMNIHASVREMYDAGWRIESVNVGPDHRENDVTEMPLTLTLRKLF